MSNSVQLFQQFGLVNANINYSEIANAFVTCGYTSRAGNTYFNCIRVAEGIMIKEDVGQASYGLTFLNHIQIYSIKNKTLIADGHYHSLQFSRNTERVYIKSLLLRMLRDASESNGTKLDEKEANRVLDNVVDQAMNEDQRKLLMNQTQKYLPI